ncbi:MULTISPECIES: hypothetical protein [unclassified Imperialibacter]|jgi:hypothetical protein|uniref:hypothetical protein n=1 Tax=unclassified Imperialibacter TaxID=2629706 RepID=UPI001259165B|nr:MULTISPECIES: hypothetical protein [unclassified Imperialibacter]CAD5274273.1 conserved hypothetical protein [Imperialibacter sp. 75]CAD5287901.1 conserved hypothetical protein [Imperialibacter sp. 89]VVT35567.1 conserved hypothetical protein [Imperialibacter sp. EC-SDR9]|tara:strand:- start:204 stop:563 length:360 start_codon:yes stop_codon:yes gene_type:complete|eukprot:TRINITY_DN141246_c0_g1_i1.p1 TRINITY_DN141246_c0_g1~~TRINITY_DN141246_c0_g1_i1.p1  ORF type:complete len:120 (+),score=4.02 TRINITY_DN141246_c0_g1_i1:86-445(+)
MRIPSIIRLPRYKNFDYTPRHYDPVKEDIEERTRKIKNEMNEDAESGTTSSIAGAFRRKTGSSFTGTNYSTSLLQLVIAVILLGGFVGYLFYGNQVFYFLMLGVPVYLYFRFRGIFFKK